MILTLEGWRGKKFTMDLPRRLLLAAPNGAGKTNIMQGILCALGQSALCGGGNQMRPYLDDGATAEISADGWVSTALFKKTEKTGKFSLDSHGDAPQMRGLFVDFSKFLESKAARAEAMDGLVDASTEDLDRAARAGARAAMLELLSPGGKWANKLLDAIECAQTTEAVDALRLCADAAGINDAKKTMAAAKKAATGAAETAANAPEQAQGRDPQVVQRELEEIRTKLAEAEKDNQRAAYNIKRRAELALTIAALKTVDPKERAALEKELGDINIPDTGPIHRALSRCQADLGAVIGEGRPLQAQLKLLGTGKCPTCGQTMPDAEENIRKRQEGLAHLRSLAVRKDELDAKIDELQKELVKVKQQQDEHAARVQNIRDKLQCLPQNPADELLRCEAELANLPESYLDEDAVKGMRARLDDLSSEIEIAQRSRAALTVVSGLNLPLLDLAVRVANKAEKGWKAGRAAALAKAISPVEDRMGALLQRPVTISPENEWSIMVGAQEAEAFSEGERLPIWGAFVAALAPADSVILCEAAGADSAKLLPLLSALSRADAALIAVATHVEGEVPEAWTAMDPRRLV